MCNQATKKFAVFFLALCSAVIATGQDRAEGATVAQYNLGEDDAGSAAGNTGNATTTAAVGSNLIRIGDPTYSATVPAGGSMLSMAFDGTGDYYYGDAPTTDLTNDFSYTFDANMTAASGSFSFVASLGSNFGGISLIESGPAGAGNIGLFLPGIGTAGAVDVFTPAPGVWNEYQVSWDATQQQLSFSVDGNLISQTDTGTLPANGQVVDALTLGGNFRLNEDATAAPRAEGDFEGSFNGLIDNFVFDGTAPAVLPTLTVDRDTGSLSFINGSGNAIDILGYRITSEFQSLNAANWTSIASNYDAGSPGPNQVDPDDNWAELSPNPNFSLSEFESEGGNGATLPNGVVIDLGSGDGVTTFGPWTASPVQDVQMELLLTDGTIDQNVDVVYTGNGDAPLQRSDLDTDGDIDADDWSLYIAGLDVDLSAMTNVGAYFMGDLDGDLDNDVDDFALFKADFVAANSLEAFQAAAAGVPEPSSFLLISMGAVLLISKRQRSSERKMNQPVCSARNPLPKLALLLAVTLAVCGFSNSYAAFEIVGQYNLGEDDAGASAGGAGNDPTTAAVGNDLVRLGSPTYSADVPAGGSSLSMLFPGNGEGADGTDSFYYREAPTTDVTQNITYSFDAKANGTSGFQFLTSLGGNFGGISVIMFGNDVSVFFPGVGGGTGNLNVNDGQWHNYQVDYRYNGGGGNELTTLSVDGNVVSTREGPTANAQIVNAFTIGGNFRGEAVDDAPVIGSEILTDFEGGFNGLIDNVVVSTFIQPLLTLEVNTTTGETRILNDSSEPIEFDFYTIKSAGGALAPGGFAADTNNDGDVDGADFLALQRSDTNLISTWESEFGSTAGAAGWNSLQDQDLAGFPGGGTGWREGGGANANSLSEARVDGSSVLGNGADLNLGAAFVPSVFGSGTDGDLTFQFRDVSGAILDGNIIYVTHGSLASSTVPEPSSMLLLLAGTVIGLSHRRGQAVTAKQSMPIRSKRGMFAALLLCVMSLNVSHAAFTVDRDYKLGDGDNDNGSPAAGAVVGSTTSTGDSFDDAGMLGDNSLIDLTPEGNPVYANVSSRPLANGSSLGITFDGVDDYLTTFNLGLPETSISSTGSTQQPLGGGGAAVGPLDYVGIANRGYQFWVNPNDAALGGASQQAVVLDSNEHGVLISDTGTWVIQYGGGQQFDSGVAVKTDATDGGWSHVMLVRPNGAAGGAWLYVDGEGVGAIGGGYNGGDRTFLTVGASTGDLANAENADDPGMADFFTGVVDDLEMFVLGTSTGGTVFGDFDFATDNEFAANDLAGAIAGDVDRNGSVNQADVVVFAANFDTVNAVNGVQLPDLAYREDGDLNLDGAIDLADAFILHGGLLAAGLGGLDFNSLYGVPEPTSCVLLLTASALALMHRRRVWWINSKNT